MDRISRIVIFVFILTTVSTVPLVTNYDQLEIVGEYGEHFEGDIILTRDQAEYLFGKTRNGLISTKYRWPNKTVPYQLSSEHSKEEQDYIEKGLRVIESISCVKFVRRTNEDDYVQLQGQDGGCYSFVGRQGGKQILNLQKYAIETGCFRLGTIMHEFLHALGFYHMQSAHDRDDYVTIEWNNIKPGTQHNFNKYTNTQVTHFNTTYDYLSVMHYSAYGFSINGRPTIVPKDEKYLKIIGQRKGLSQKDMIKLNAMYECEEKK